MIEGATGTEQEQYLQELTRMRSNLLKMMGRSEKSAMERFFNGVANGVQGAVNLLEEHDVAGKVGSLYRLDIFTVCMGNLIFMFLLPSQKGFNTILGCVLLSGILGFALINNLRHLSVILSVDIIYLTLPYIEHVFIS